MSVTMPIRVLHVISGLGLAGAETVLYRLLSASHRDRVESEVISLTHGGPNADRIEALGIPVTTCDLREQMSRANPLPLFQLARLLRHREPDVVQTWLYHADVIGGVAARLSTHAAVVWNLRHGLVPQTQHSLRWLLRTSVRLSRRVPDRIVACAASVRDAHVSIGYPVERMHVIPNGIDARLYRPDPEARASLRAELGIAPETPVIGRIGRFYPQKDYRGLVAAAAHVRRVRPDARFVLCGWDVDPANAELGGWIREAGLGDVFHLLGRRDDVARIAAACDVACSSSLSEGFPNTIAEAMACAVPCVATDVGDSASIVGKEGRIVPPHDAEALAHGLLALVAMPIETRRALGRAARRRIVSLYSLEAMASRYEELYEELAPGRVERGPAAAAANGA